VHTYRQGYFNKGGKVPQKARFLCFPSNLSAIQFSLAFLARAFAKMGEQRRADTSRNQRRDIKLMYRLGYTQNAIGLGLQLSRGQIQYAVTHNETPVKRPGRPSLLSQAQLKELKAFITASQYNRQMPYRRIPGALGWNVGEYCIHHALQKLGYKRCIAKIKPPISEKNKELQLHWALEHRD
jgi:transposase